MKTIAAILVLAFLPATVKSQCTTTPVDGNSTIPAELCTLKVVPNGWVAAGVTVDCNWWMIQVNNALGVQSTLLYRSVGKPAGAFTSADGKLNGTIVGVSGPWPILNTGISKGSCTTASYVFQGQRWNPSDGFAAWYGSTTEYYWCRNP